MTQPPARIVVEEQIMEVTEDITDKPLLDVIKQLDDWSAKYGEQTYLVHEEPRGSYSDPNPRHQVFLYRKRPETDAEYETRCRNEEARLRFREQADRQEYLRLRAKYEAESQGNSLDKNSGNG